ncbi:DNA-directed RNA polymerase subunit beta' [Striga asiatica]|uniref:DNA-directed RNA polymerase subunit beta n=1 Tax=Striga asiatica TaxID=4170 RepID=A0A5A7RD94_STRAF|nr:DNA-directed RNA polymerase subunit beta' [Striga asiatica]
MKSFVFTLVEVIKKRFWSLQETEKIRDVIYTEKRFPCSKNLNAGVFSGRDPPSGKGLTTHCRRRPAADCQAVLPNRRKNGGYQRAELGPALDRHHGRSRWHALSGGSLGTGDAGKSSQLGTNINGGFNCPHNK